jgi:hypothetical protein
MIFKKIGTKSNFAEKVIITLVFGKNANFVAVNGQKSQKIVIITFGPWCQWCQCYGIWYIK